MRISHRYKYIFFANPKTGSETVRKILDPHCDVKSVGYRDMNTENPFYVHMLPREASQVFSTLKWDYDDYFKFVFVRNPWARLVSIYEMIFAGYSIKPDFAAWLYQMEPGGTGGGGRDHERWRRFGTYSIDNFIKDEAGKILVDRVIRLEDIEMELPVLLGQLGIPTQEKLVIPHLNRNKYDDSGNHSDYKAYYTTETRKYVERDYGYDIREYNYEFDNG